MTQSRIQSRLVTEQNSVEGCVETDRLIQHEGASNCPLNLTEAGGGERLIGGNKAFQDSPTALILRVVVSCATVLQTPRLAYVSNMRPAYMHMPCVTVHALCTQSRNS